MPANQLTVVGDTVMIEVPRRRSMLSVQIDLNGATGVNVVLEGRKSSSRGFTNIKMTDAATGTLLAAGLTTDEQIGYAENIGYREVQARLTAITAGGPVNVVIDDIGYED